MGRLRAPDIPFPSFSFVLSTYSSQMRLPSYRSSYLLRYHPYPRYAPSQRERLMQTVDERNHIDNGDANDAPEVGAVLWPALQERDEETTMLEEALRAVEDLEGERSPPRRRSISTLIILMGNFPGPSAVNDAEDTTQAHMIKRLVAHVTKALCHIYASNKCGRYPASARTYIYPT
ncbi:hypothetical protein BV22DRAFT_1129975 [Leucogyrophana mollusca]|uniref:Uncharacterized protein n=1 Tax=Leucogyrophana mollusca TaxID=85980 RepID=A0ACB8BI96_9AGAM|nr:hypothetical protein BV22DRAFT_1129975 [Leucogyrophana mollusca]